MSIFEYKKSNQSENGEDGIINFIFDKLNIKFGSYLDIGSKGGIYNSNTFMLFKKNWKGYYIESDLYIFKDLVENFKKFENKITIIKEDFDLSDKNLLDNILEKSNIFKNFDLISIRYNNLEYKLFQSLNKYRSKVLCIYIDALIDPFLENINENDNKSYLNNFYSLKEIADKKNYFIICYTGYLILIDNLYKPLFKEYIKNSEEIYLDFLNNLTFEKLETLYQEIMEDKNKSNYKNNKLIDFYNKKINNNNEISNKRNIDDEILVIEKALLEILTSLKNIKELQKESLK